MSRSVTMPHTSPSCVTTMSPMFSSRIATAASRIGASASIVTGSGVMTSATVWVFATFDHHPPVRLSVSDGPWMYPMSKGGKRRTSLALRGGVADGKRREGRLRSACDRLTMSGIEQEGDNETGQLGPKVRGQSDASGGPVDSNHLPL